MAATYSHSSLGTFRQCPQKYKFEKIDKVKIPRRLYAHFHLGSTVHRQLKIAYDWAVDGKLYPLDTMLAAFEADWSGERAERIVLTGEHLTVDDEIAIGRRMLTEFHNNYKPFDQGKLVGSEMALTFDIPGSPARFTTRIDRLMKLDDGTYQICDYKTGRQVASGVADSNFRLQMGMYQLAVRAAYPDFEPIEVAQHFLRQDELIRYRFRPDELDELEEQFRSEVAEIAYATRMDDWPAREGGYCRWCDYTHLCPAKRHRLLLEAEEETGQPVTASEAVELTDRYLELYVQKKEIDAELTKLKADLIDAAAGLEVNKLEGAQGYVTVKSRTEEKIPTKTDDAVALGEVTALVRSWNVDGAMEGCFKLDDRAVLDLIRKGRLTEEQKESLQPFLVRKSSSSVYARPAKSEDDEDDN